MWGFHRQKLLLAMTAARFSAFDERCSTGIIATLRTMTSRPFHDRARESTLEASTSEKEVKSGNPIDLFLVFQ